MALTLDGVVKRDGAQTHIHETSLTLERGGMTVLLGATLAGKTTLMRLMAGLDRPDAGRVLWDGRDVTGVRVQDRNVAMVYQQFINYPAATVWENIASPLRLRRLGAAAIRAKVEQAAALVRLGPDQLSKTPLELSGGQQQRCALARALVKDADLVLLDEPLANLDYKLREELREEIPRIFAESGAVFVYATTEPEEALLLGGRVACLHEGAVTQCGPTAEVYRAPGRLTTARVFSDPPINTASVVKRGGLLDFGDGVTAPAPDSAMGLRDGAYAAAFRPHHLLIHRPEAAATVAFAVRVAVTEITGSESFVHVDCGDRRWTAVAHGVHEPPIGAEMRVFVEPRRLLLFGEGGVLVAADAQAEAA